MSSVMARMPSNELSRSAQQTLLSIARQSIEYGLENNQPLPVNLEQVDAPLKTQGCCFVTLHKAGELRGCIGALSPFQPLAQDVAEHAFAAAFQDPRFLPVTAEEIPELQIEISVLGPQELIPCDSERSLLTQLQPVIDGLSLESEYYRATFLPSVWSQLPDKKQFLQALKRKAGMPEGDWPDAMKAYRYHTQSFTE